MYNLLARSLEDEYAAFSERADMVNVVYNPLAGGLLTGRYTDSAQIPEAGRFRS
jgi:aryl-alcohol dehydrogenase-like predicted oxidoreductase